MTSDYEQRRAARAKRLQDQTAAEKEKEVVIGETRAEIKKDIKAGQDIKIKINEVGPLELRSSVDLFKGDSVKVSLSADPSMSEVHSFNWGHANNPPDESYGTITGRIKKDHDIKIKIDNMDVPKIKSAAALDEGDSIRLIISKL